MLSLFMLTGCDSVLSGIGALMCSLAPDSDHCFQRSAVQWGNPATCEKIKWTKFKNSWSNPPRDKCYLTIAENTQDWTVCKKIQWGLMSYTQDECIRGVSKNIFNDAIQKDDANGCKKLAQLPYKDDYNQCKAQLYTVDKVKGIDQKMDDIIAQLKNDKNNADLKKQLAMLEKQKSERYLWMSDGQKQQYFWEKKEAIMSDIDDEDVKSAIAKEYIANRSSTNETDINKLLTSLKDITERQKMIKQIDDDANSVMDEVKWQLVDMMNEKQDEVLDSAKEKAVDWINENGWDKLKRSLKNLEWAKDKYDKWSKQYEELNSKYQKLKWVYDEAMWIYKKIDEFNTLVAKWKLTEWQAKVLKWWVLLWKWLEYTTQYVPVFGSTISTITKDTFEATMKFATKRAQRTTAMDKCIEAPLDCDFDHITAY